jgi:hypothetical protein
MMRMFRSMALAVAVLSGGLLTASSATASDGKMRIDDEAGLFSTEGIAKAKDAFQGTTFKSPTQLTVHTVKRIPADKLKEFDAVKSDANGRGKFVADWARELAKKEGRKADVYALILTNDKGAFVIKVVSDRQTGVHREFTDRKSDDIAKQFGNGFRAVAEKKLEGVEANHTMDSALQSATELVIADLKETAAPQPKTQKTSTTRATSGANGGFNVGGLICTLLCVGLGIWLVVGIIRALTGGGGGYGGGYGGGPGYGGSGGGFMSSLFGGMFGAMAGMWMYNNFFGGSTFSNDAMAGESYGADGTADTGDGDYAGGSEGGDAGGDWGGSGGGGDFGGGGGDFGGGDW